MHTKTLKQLSGLLKDKKISATELAQTFLNRIAHSDLNAFTSVEPELTLAEAKAADARIASGEAGDLIVKKVAAEANGTQPLTHYSTL